MSIQPRVIRLRDAAAYLGMDKNRFNAEVRPYVTTIRIGSQGIAFDRLDLDEWFEDYKARNGVLGDAKKGGENCRIKNQQPRQGSSNGEISGTFRRELATEGGFERVVEQVMRKKRKGI